MVPTTEEAVTATACHLVKRGDGDESAPCEC